MLQIYKESLILGTTSNCILTAKLNSEEGYPYENLKIDNQLLTQVYYYLLYYYKLNSKEGHCP